MNILAAKTAKGHPDAVVGVLLDQQSSATAFQRCWQKPRSNFRNGEGAREKGSGTWRAGKGMGCEQPGFPLSLHGN